MNELARRLGQIGNRGRRTGKSQQLTQTQLGAKAGLRQETISLIENGNAATRLDTILAVPAALDLEFRITQRSRSSATEIEEIF